ncbi:MAG: class I SAM-dependent methyltransferase, partial [Proteobacteria bacterium]|nr:class I SAM-dependent methyltransferase [Pseudomonadota bacterium]
VRAVPTTPLHRWAIDFMLGFLSRIERGCLTIDMPDGTIHRLGTPEPGLEATMRIGNYDFFLRLVKDGDVALGEGYSAGEYACDDITTMLRIFIENRSRLEDKRLFTTWLGRFVNRVRHLARSNNLTGSRRNIRDHYDLGDRLFTRFLDPSMTYSCAVFDHPDQGLEEAQANKRRMLIRKARLGPNDHLLEIGCGWGALAIDAVRQTGCRVTGITLSDDQLRIARERVRAAGLEDRIDLRLCDYRTLEGQFDRIISVEMLEAVGHENLGDFFASCDRLLAPNGFVVLQVITTPDDSYEVYRRHCDWIQKVIFPGSLCPAFSALTAAMARRSRFVVEHVEN